MKVFFPFLLFFLPAFALLGQNNKDTLQHDFFISTRDTLCLNEYIYFTARLTKPISVSTIICSCGQKDFCYWLFIWRDNKWELFLSHEDDFTQNQCACKCLQRTFVNGSPCSIPPINTFGIFRLEIGGIVSNEFVVTKEISQDKQRTRDPDKLYKDK
jgi:hypothetical protein